MHGRAVAFVILNSSFEHHFFQRRNIFGATTKRPRISIWIYTKPKSNLKILKKQPPKDHQLLGRSRSVPATCIQSIRFVSYD